MFEYHNNSIKTYEIKGLRQTHEVDGRIFMRISKKGMFEFVNGKAKLIPDGDLYKNIYFMNVLPYSDGDIIIVSSDGLLLYDGQGIYKFSTQADDFLKKHRIISAKIIANDVMALGTFSAGLLIMNVDGVVLQHINTESGLKDNLITSIYQDANDNLWLTTGNNITYVLTSIPLSKFNQSSGLNNTTYTSVEKDGRLYVGNTSGLYYKKWSNSENNMNYTTATFKQLGRPFNVWSVDTVNGTLLSATNMGVVELKGDSLRNVVDNVGVWKFLKLNNNPNLLIAGTNENLILLEYKLTKKGVGHWYFKHKIKGFSGKCRFVVIDKSNNIWLPKSPGVLTKLSLNESMDSVTVQEYNHSNGLPKNGRNYIHYINDLLLVATTAGMYQYDEENNKFVESDEFNSLLTKNVQVLSMIEDTQGNVYYKQMRKLKSNDEDVFELGKLVLQEDGTYKNADKTPYYRLRNSIYSLKGDYLFSLKIPNEAIYNETFSIIAFFCFSVAFILLLFLFSNLPIWFGRNSISLKEFFIVNLIAIGVFFILLRFDIPSTFF